jgi:DNA-nicking Smr family endonuclease
MSRRRRSLTGEERKLWAHVARGVVPMKGRVLPLEPEAPENAAREPKPEPALRPAPLPLASPKPNLLPLVPLERKTLTGLRRGTRDVDARIDLHGLRQSEAHEALLRFLYRAQGKGHALVLVITGKGGTGRIGDLYEERGVLRRLVPHWLGLPDLRSLVIGFEEASAHHGGSGALYVRLRRRRGADAP